MNRTELQSNAVTLLRENRRVLAAWGTGSGKTKVAVDYINTYEPHKVLLVVAERAHKQNWKEEFTKFLGEERGTLLYNNCTVECYASLKKYVNTKWDIIVFDEFHHIFTPIRLNIVKYIKSDYILGLSATVPYKNLPKLEFIYGKFTVDKFTLQASIDEGFINEPKFIKVPLHLDNTYKSEVFEMKIGKTPKRTITDDIKNIWKYRKNKNAYNNTIIKFSCTQQEKYNLLTSDVEYWQGRSQMNPSNKIYHNMWMLAGSKRKRALGEMKTVSIMKLVSKVRKSGKKFICFCTSIEQAELLGNKNAISSKNNKSLKVIEKFNNNTVKELFAINMAQEGLNLSGIQVGIISQLDGNERAMVQKSGRALRADSPVIYLMYFEDTRDMDYLKNALEGINSDYITTIKL